jgi:hypothetical protein
MKQTNLIFGGWGRLAASLVLVGCSGHVDVGRDIAASSGGAANRLSDSGNVDKEAGGTAGEKTGSGGTGGNVTGQGGTGGSNDPIHHFGTGGSDNSTGGSDNSGGTGGFVPVAPVVQCIADPGIEDAGPRAGGNADAGASCPCTRRDHLGSLNCPVGTGKYAGNMIGPEGGVVVLDGTPSTNGVPVQLTVPYGALKEPHVISISETMCPPPQAFRDTSPVYQIDPPDLKFTIPAELQIPWTVSSGSTVEPKLSIYVSRGGAFERVADSYINAGFSQGTVTQLGSFFTGWPKPADELACP